MVTDPPNDAGLGHRYPEKDSPVTETPNISRHLLPDRHPQHDLFICDVADAVLKDVIQQMEHPFYSLSKKPETAVRRYEHNGHWLEVIPSVKGLATIYDKDILIYAISQLMAKLKAGQKISRRVRINSHEFLAFSNRGTGGKDYRALVDSLERLGGTRITTNIRAGDEEQIDTFGLIESSSVRRKFGLDGRLLWVEITLSDWVFSAIEAKEVLTLHPQYFRLRKPLERRIYELARKHCGQQTTWKCAVELLYKKTGSKSPLKQFRYLLRDITEKDHLPDYMLEFLEGSDEVLFINRETMPKDDVKPDRMAENILLRLDPDIDEEARQIAVGWDIHHIRSCFASWWYAIGCPDTKNPDAFFLKFCRTWQEKRGHP